MELNAKLNREKEENKNINKKNNKESDAKNKILILGILILIVSGLFLSIGLNANNMDYALSQRIPKLLSIILTGVCISISTTIFQTITGNKILTPNVMGLDSLYVLIQTVIVFVLGSSSIFIVNKKYNFIICVGGMILLSSLLYKMMFKKENSWNIFKEALNEAKDSLVEVNVTQDKTTEAERNLNNAKDNLIFKANKEVLSAKIEEVKSIDLSKYTEESSSVLKDALYKALNIEADENAMQEAVDEAILKLDEAIKSLVEKIIGPDVDYEIEDDDSIGDSSKDEEDDKDQNPVIEDTKKNPTINDNIRKEESTEKDKGTGKLPTTGKESGLIFISFAAAIIGTTFLKKRKKA